MLQSKIKQTAQESNLPQNSYFQIAEVTYANEMQNCCDIRTHDFLGKPLLLKEVQVQINSPHFLSYFPKVGDLVIVHKLGAASIITSTYYNTHQEIYSNTQVKKNSLSITEYGVCEGNIL